MADEDGCERELPQNDNFQADDSQAGDTIIGLHENNADLDMARLQGSIPMSHTEYDHNANTIPDHKWSVSSPHVHLVPMREGRILLPKRYQQWLEAYKIKQLEIRSDHTKSKHLQNASSQRTLTNPTEDNIQDSSQPEDDYNTLTKANNHVSADQPPSGEDSTPGLTEGSNSEEMSPSGEDSTPDLTEGSNSEELPPSGEDSTPGLTEGSNSEEMSSSGEDSTPGLTEGSNSEEMSASGEDSTPGLTERTNSEEQPPSGEDSTPGIIEGSDGTDQTPSGDISNEDLVEETNRTKLAPSVEENIVDRSEETDKVNLIGEEELNQDLIKGNDDTDIYTDTDTDTLRHDRNTGISNKWPDRLGDLETAMKWIRQEVLQIKQEDRFLTRRLLDISAQIHRMQGLPSHLSLSSNLARLGSRGSDMDVATWNSFMSLDERALGGSGLIAETSMTVKELLLSFQNRNDEFLRPDMGTLGRGLRGYGTDLGDTLSRSASTREPIKNQPRIKRKNSLPMANELEEDHFFDEEDSD